MSSTYVICGFGRVGKSTANAMLSHRHPQDIVVIDHDFMRIEEASSQNFRTVFGDAADLRTMRLAQAGLARDVIVCVTGQHSAAVVRTARKVAPTAHIRAGIPTPEFRDALIAAGADEVIVISDVAGVLLAGSLKP